MTSKKEPDVIAHLTHALARFAGRLLSLGIAAVLLLAWLVTGPLFHLSDLYRTRFKTK